MLEKTSHRLSALEAGLEADLIAALFKAAVAQGYERLKAPDDPLPTRAMPNLTHDFLGLPLHDMARPARFAFVNPTPPPGDWVMAIVGEAGPRAEIEMLLLLWDTLPKIGIKGFELVINPGAEGPAGAAVTEITTTLSKAAFDWRTRLETKQDRHHAEMTFSLVASDTQAPFVKGGRTQFGADNENCVIARLSLSDAIHLMPPPPTEQRVYMPYTGSRRSDAEKLRSEGWVTIAGLNEHEDMQAEAAKQNCDYIFFKGDIIKAGE
ncbi:MAG: hypothetical protein AB7U41_04605 [Dongiaceae bacterium]